jgi:flagellar hook-associated protein 2
MTTVSSNASSAASPPPATTSTPSNSATTNPSGVDWTALIQSEVDAALAPATTINTTITNNGAKVAAYQQLQTLLSTLATDTLPLTSSNTSLSGSVFSSVAATVALTGTESGDGSGNLSMSLAAGAPPGLYTMTISQLAQAQQVAGSTAASQSTALGYSGVFSLGLEGGASSNITVTPGMTLQGLEGAINAQSATTNVQASIVQVSGSQFELVLSGTQDGENIVTSSVSGDDVLGKLGVTDSSGGFTDQLQQAQPAELTLNGIQITRNTNDISDLVSGMTFNLLAPTAQGATLNVNVGTDAGAITTALQSLVTDYNAVQSFVASQQQLNSDGTPASGSVLFGDNTMNTIMDQLQSVFSTSVNGLSFADLGLSFDPNASASSTTLAPLDTATLDATLASNLTGVEQLLAAQATSSSSELTTIAGNSTAPPSFTLDLAVDSSGDLMSASVNGDSTMFSVTGDTITGNQGTPYAGMAFAYSGNTSQSISVTTSPGIGGLLNSISTLGSDTHTGSLQAQITNLGTTDANLQQQSDDITAQATTLQTQLQNQFAQYQAAISQSNTSLNYLQALLDAEVSSSQ